MRITTEKGKKDKIHIYVDGEYKMTVDEAFWLSQGIPEKGEIDEDVLFSLENSVLGRRAFNKALDILSQREHSRRELITKLTQRGHSRENAEKAADKLTQYGYLDDERFARLYAKELKEKKKFGKARIKQELFRKGIDRDITYAVLAETEDNSEEEIAEILKKKYPLFSSDEKVRNRAINALIRYGYGVGEIKKAMLSFDNNEEEYYDNDIF